MRICSTVLTWSCLLLVATLPVEAQTTASTVKKAAPPPGTLHTVAIKGNRLYGSAEIVRQTGLKAGQHVTADIIEEGRRKLLSTELFSNVSDEFRFSGSVPPAYDLTFNVVENEQLFPMRFERLGVSAEEVKSYLKSHIDLYSDRIPGTEAVLKRYTGAVQDFVRQKDPATTVKSMVSNDDPQELAVVFTTTSPAPTISQVVVSGNQAVDTGSILRAVNSVAVGVPLSDMRLKLILDGAIKPLYAAKGYAAVTFPKVETEPSKTNLGVIVKVEIKDGPVFKFGALRFHGNGLDEDEIRSNISFKPGQTYDGDKVTNFRIDLLHRLRRKGFLDASITADAEPDDEKRAVNVVYNVVPGAVYNFDKLDIRGLDATAEPAVAKLWGEKPGKPFNPDYPDFFLKRVQEQGYFDNLANTHSDYTADASTHNVTVLLDFKGGESAKEKDRKKKEEEERRRSDGSWSPYP